LETFQLKTGFRKLRHSIYAFLTDAFQLKTRRFSAEPPLSANNLNRVARFLLVQNTKTGKNRQNYPKITQKYNKWPKDIPNVHKIRQNLTLQGSPKCNQIPIFVLKINHLATLNLKLRTKLFVYWLLFLY
jgi:hypothetical protein